MPAYVVVRATVSNPEAYEAYKAAAEAAIAEAGGRYLIRGGEMTTLEGTGDPRRMVVLEFPDRAAAQAWYDGPAYQRAIALRAGIAEMDAQIVDGV